VFSFEQAKVQTRQKAEKKRFLPRAKPHSSQADVLGKQGKNRKVALIEQREHSEARTHAHQMSNVKRWKQSHLTQAPCANLEMV
jgi:hypothetical protein